MGSDGDLSYLCCVMPWAPLVWTCSALLWGINCLDSLDVRYRFPRDEPPRLTITDESLKVWTKYRSKFQEIEMVWDKIKDLEVEYFETNHKTSSITFYTNVDNFSKNVPETNKIHLEKDLSLQVGFGFLIPCAICSVAWIPENTEKSNFKHLRVKGKYTRSKEKKSYDFFTPQETIKFDMVIPAFEIKGEQRPEEPNIADFRTGDEFMNFFAGKIEAFGERD